MRLRYERNNGTSTTDFILLGPFFGFQRVNLVVYLILLVYFIALTGNSVLIFLIWVDFHLHTPMYFLLSQLSLIDLVYISSSVPKMAINHWLGKHTISHIGCGVQMFFCLTLGGAECLLLTLMSYDRYVAVCNPLRYPIIMSPKVCLLMAAVSWAGGALNSLIQTNYTMHFPICGLKEINHFFCEMPAILKLSCEDTLNYEMMVSVVSVAFILIPFSIIISSYIRIFLTVLRMNSPEGRNKALATCSSHLIVVSLYLGPGIVVYMTPGSSHTPELDQGLSMFYTILTPMLNPIIYSLRNKEVMEALRNVLKRNLISK
ncbi:LOW QUALITY PROTEIN: olfactory receptor 2T27-like [Orycteropus afer afer]|uniref:Olfactory receptor n=1 Tax=Orycteropus afer afer TaxID=1230840 RepID=A0A8B7B5X5_ORYAF|nr:LOW QUALITY PROTEIN: olfactory receptor 2T27-like [Orycteropus afer afer]